MTRCVLKSNIDINLFYDSTLKALWKKPNSVSCAVDENIDSGIMLNVVTGSKSAYISLRDIRRQELVTT